jgi:dTDP-4-amino-4,6-dideoxygalactose transaminase
MVITNDRVLYERALMYHDVAASGERGDELQTADRFTGINCRLSEIQAAVMLAQLDRLDPILDDMRRSKAAIAAHVEDLARSRGIEPRRVNDAEGDAAISLVFFGKDVEQAEYISRALQAEGAEADVLFRPDSHDYHVYYHWDPILEKRSWAPTTPWSWIEGEVQYSKDMCPRTLDFLGRAVHLDISPDLTEQNVQEISAALTKVFNALPEAQ